MSQNYVSHVELHLGFRWACSTIGFDDWGLIRDARFHELDALRAFAMLLGVVLHASLFLVTMNQVVARDLSP